MLSLKICPQNKATRPYFIMLHVKRSKRQTREGKFLNHALPNTELSVKTDLVATSTPVLFLIKSHKKLNTPTRKWIRNSQ